MHAIFRVVSWLAWTLVGGTVAGWTLARAASWVMDNPITLDMNLSYDQIAHHFTDNILWIDPRCWWFFWIGFMIIALIGMGSYDYGGKRREAKELKDKEYGDSRWATMEEMRKFAHETLTRKVGVRLPRRWREKMTMLRNSTGTFIHGALGIKQTKANPKPENCESIADDNIILSETAALQLSKIPDPELERNKHVYVLGGSGSGKTFNFVGPNLLQLNSSYVITDPKGDTLKQYGRFFLKHGYELKVVNTKPSELANSMHYNPLLYITDATSIIQITNLLISNTSGDKNHASEDFFVKAERQLYMALIGYLHYYYADQPQYRTFNEMVNLLQMAKGDDPNAKISPLDVIMCKGSERFMSYEDWVISKHGGNRTEAEKSDEWFVITQYKGFKSTSGSPETEASVIASCNVRMAPFSVGNVRTFFSEDELNLHDIGEKPTAFFLVMSDTDTTFNFILAMLLYQLFDINTDAADKRPGSHCKIPIQCILDELANIGEIPDLDVKIATLRSRWIYLDCILQSTTQLKKLYKDNAAIIEGNCDTTLVLGRLDQESNKNISERLGKHTVVVKNRSESHGKGGSWSESESRIAKDLISASDLGTNPEAFAGEECIVLIKNAHPYKDYKYRTTDHPRYHELKEVGEFNLPQWNRERTYAKRMAEIEAVERVDRARQELIDFIAA